MQRTPIPPAVPARHGLLLQTTVFSLLVLGARSADGQVAPRSLPLSLFAAALPGAAAAGPARGFVDVGEAFEAAAGQLLLLGEPGAGKTTRLWPLRARRSPGGSRIRAALPLLGRIASWTVAGEPPLAEWLAAQAGCDTAPIERALADGRALLLLDGLDANRPRRRPPEARRAARRAAGGAAGRTRALHRRAGTPRLGTNRVLLSRRSADYATIGRRLALGGAATLQPLNDVQFAAYLAAQPRLAAELQRDPSLGPMVRTPPPPSMLTYAVQGEALPADGDASGSVRERVFQRDVARRFEHEALRANAALAFSRDEAYRVLGIAAGEQRGFRIPHLGTRDGVPLELSIANEAAGRADDFIAQALRLHLLVRDEHGVLRFAHLLLRDHFGIAQVERGGKGYRGIAS